MAVISLTIANIALAIHIVSALAAFGVMLVHPLLARIAGAVLAPDGLPPYHRVQVQIIRRLVNPGVILVVASGLLLAFDTAVLDAFYVRWGIAAAIALGAIAEGYLAPRQAQLAELASRDLRADAGALSCEYETLSRQVARVGLLASGIVLATVVVMVAHT